jgi:hypothetical protein
VPWCKYFIPKISATGISPDDPELNEHIMYAKCVKGHVIRDAADWIQCENLPAPDATCWQEGGVTLLTLTVRNRENEQQNKRDDEKQSNGRSLSQAAVRNGGTSLSGRS